jgi:uncharacterized protein (TIGR02186 family)
VGPRKLVGVLLLVATLLVTKGARSSPAEISLRVDPAVIDLDTSFAGATVQVSGHLPRAMQLAIRCRGHDQTLALKRKGKVWGLLWMSTATVTFERVPSLYLLSSSAPLRELGPPAVLRRLGVGYDAVRGHVLRDNKDGKADFTELIKLKEREGMFALGEKAITLTPAQHGVRFHGNCRLPARTPEGDYRVEVFGFKQGAGALLARRTVKLRQVGLTRWISSLASERGLLYGILVVVIALCCGLLTGLVFGLRSKGH